MLPRFPSPKAAAREICICMCMCMPWSTVDICMCVCLSTACIRRVGRARLYAVQYRIVYSVSRPRGVRVGEIGGGERVDG